MPAILLDIEGTTSSISFVYDTMFPYVQENLRGYLESAWDTPEFESCLPVLAQDMAFQAADKTSFENWLKDGSREEKINCVAQAVLNLMDADVKSTGLKQLQGLIWKDGFESGELVAHVYDDVPVALGAWYEAGIDIRIYSSGSIASQKLFFGHTIAGNLLTYLKGHYDTTTGPKREPASYENIAAKFSVPAGEILFVSDVVEELAAAQSAGMQTALSIRPGNAPVPEGHSFVSITGFDELEV